MIATRTLDTLDDVLAVGGWTPKSVSMWGVSNAARRAWTKGYLWVFAFNDRGEHSYIAAQANVVGWLWRVEITDDQAALLRVIEAAEALAEQSARPDPGPVFSALTAAGWSLHCGGDPDGEASMAAAAPELHTVVTHLPDSLVDPGSWAVTRADGSYFVASSSAPTSVVLALANA